MFIIIHSPSTRSSNTQYSNSKGDEKNHHADTNGMQSHPVSVTFSLRVTVVVQDVGTEALEVHTHLFKINTTIITFHKAVDYLGLNWRIFLF